MELMNTLRSGRAASRSQPHPVSERRRAVVTAELRGLAASQHYGHTLWGTVFLALGAIAAFWVSPNVSALPVVVLVGGVLAGVITNALAQRRLEKVLLAHARAQDLSDAEAEECVAEVLDAD